MSILEQIQERSKNSDRQVAVLIDPDNYEITELDVLHDLCVEANVDYFFFGGSLVTTSGYEEKIGYLKAMSNIPVIIFPGNLSQISGNADAILFLSLISGRNPDLLIGQQVTAAPMLKKLGIETIPTGYMLIDTGRLTTAQYISSTYPIPYDKPEVAASTALAGQMLGLQVIYADGGSGAKKPVSAQMIQAIKKHVDLPLIIGGGIKTPEEAEMAFLSGANVIVVGNQIEHDNSFIKDLALVKAGKFV